MLVSCSYCLGLHERGEVCPKRKDKQRQTNRDYDKYNRNKKAKALYDSASWRKLKEIVLRQNNYLCLHCKDEGRYVPADVVDHIKEVRDRDGWDLRLDIDNLQPLCHMHHNKKTAEEERKRRE